MQAQVRRMKEEERKQIHEKRGKGTKTIAQKGDNTRI